MAAPRAASSSIQELSLRELEGLTRRFTTEISDIIGPDSDIPAPDVNTNAQIMAWMMDTYSMHRGYTVPGVVTGKPVRIGGCEGRKEATARGAVYTHRTEAGQGNRHLDLTARGSRSRATATRARSPRASRRAGRAVVAVSDSQRRHLQPRRPRPGAGHAA